MVQRVLPSEMSEARCVKNDHWNKIVSWLIESLDTVSIDDFALFGIVDVTHRFIHCDPKNMYKGNELQRIVMGVMSLLFKVRFGESNQALRRGGVPYTVNEI